MLLYAWIYMPMSKACQFINQSDGTCVCKWRKQLIIISEHVFIFTEFNETVLEPEKGTELDESQKTGRTVGSLLVGITPSLIATVERCCQRITVTPWGAHSAGSDEQKVPLTFSYLTKLLSAWRALCLLDCQSEKKALPRVASVWKPQQIKEWMMDWWVAGWTEITLRDG